MALHFTGTELAERRRRACLEMATQGLDGLLVFRQESMYYLTGYRMVFFMHMILLNSQTGLSMSLGETSIVTEHGCEPVTHAPRRLVVN